MPHLECAISQSLWDALIAQQQLTGESRDHIVQRALADALQVNHHTLLLVKLIQALP